MRPQPIATRSPETRQKSKKRGMIKPLGIYTVDSDEKSQQPIFKWTLGGFRRSISSAMPPKGRPLI